MTEEEIFVVFDVVDKGGDPQEAQEGIRRKLHLRPPHRKTVTAVFNVGIELSKRKSNAPDALTNQEVDDIVGKAAYGMSHSRAVELHRLYLLWKIDRRKETEKRSIDTVLSTLEERQHKVWFLLRCKYWDAEKIAEKLRTPLRDVQYEIKEIEIKEQLERHKTKEETKMKQESMANLPSWVERAQWEHLEGREQRGDLSGMEIITYPGGIGIREQLELFKNSFPDINPQTQFFWVPKDEIVMAQLHGHLPDKAFWKLIEGSEGFIKKANESQALLDAAREKFTSAGKELASEKLAPLQPGSVPDVYITSGWVRRVLVRALNRELGFSEPGKYYPRELKEGDFALEDAEVIYRGPDVAKAEEKHRELVEDFTKSKKFPLIVNLMKDLRNLRQQIYARIDQCLRGREYSYNYCPDCPADQARKMLTSKEE